MFKIIPATINDIDTIINIAQNSWAMAYKNILPNEQLNYMLNLFYSPQEIKKNILNKNTPFFLFYNSNKVCGFIALQFIPQTNFTRLNKLYILPTYQGGKIGTNLIKYAIEQSEANNKKKLQLNVNRKNIEALNFYFKTGFKIIRIEDNAIGNNFFMNDFVLEKIL